MDSFNLEGIKNIIFDLGNVIVNIDVPATYKAFKELNPKKYDSIMEELEELSFFQKYETGEISSDEFIKTLQEKLDKEVSSQEIIDAWNLLLKDIPEVRFEILLALKEKYRTFCLSNTNEIHINCLFDRLQKERGLSNYDSFFEKVYFSYEMGLRKPNADIFENVLKNSHLIPSETLFIDDTLEHINTAESLGIKTYHLSEGKSIEQLFQV